MPRKDFCIVLTGIWIHITKIAVTDDNIGIVHEAFHLLEAYTEGPYEILEKNMNSIPEEYKPTALYLINTCNR